MEVEKLTELEILQEEVFLTLLDLESEVEKVELLERLENRAKKLKVLQAFKRKYKAYVKDNEEANKYVPVANYSVQLRYTDKGNVSNVIENYLSIVRNDERFKGKLRMNELSDMPEKLVNGKLELWSDVDDSKARCYIEKKYGIHNEKKLHDALNIVFQENSYNPVKDIIEAVKWDGTSRIYTILTKWLGVEDSPYSREVSRLIFAGGINRLYSPGCKFDDMPVLIGTKQGEGKSTFVSWLALNDDFFREVKEIEGQKGVEVLQGAWICEMGELLALTKAKEVEAVKAYITCRTDTYRKPYERRTTKNPRKCIFIGTTNKEQFLTDKTGNRRFYPVTVNCSGYDLFDNKEEILNDILQAWAEALHLFKEGKLSAYADRSLLKDIREHQETAVEDDYRVGLIESYLENKTTTCILELWTNALNELGKPKPKDSSDIVLILNKLDGWENTKKTQRFRDFGAQKAWVKMPF